MNEVSHLGRSGSTASLVVSSPTLVADAAREAVAAAREAQPQWARSTVGKRAAALRRAAKRMLDRRAEVIALAREEIGKVDVEGLFNEALGPLDAVNAWTRIVRRDAARRRVPLNPIGFPNKRAHIDLVARGVVGVVAPWNYPVAGLYRSVLPALLTGNGVVIKPSEHSPKTTAWFAGVLAEHLPEGLVGVVQGDGRAGSALIDADINACVFTGSPETGRKVRIQCAERGIPSSIEMGGKDAAIVLADCDLERTIAGVTHWALSNVGQACGAIEVAYVDEQIADAFVQGLRRAWTKLRAGTQRTADLGPLATRRQLEIVVDHVEDARALGALVVCGGRTRDEGRFYEPTVLDRCSAQMKVVRDETFGPVLAVVRVSGAAEAVRSINEGRYGLGASIWSADVARAERLAERLDVGVVTINNHALSGAIAALPWSGTRETGFGVANGTQSLATFVRPRTTLIDKGRGPDVYWLPYDSELLEAGDILADVQVGRAERVWKLPLLLRKRTKTIRDFFR